MPLYSSESSTISVHITLAASVIFIAPVVPYSIKILLDGNIIGVDNGAGALIGNYIESTFSTINYETGICFINFLTYDIARIIQIEYTYNIDDENYFGPIDGVFKKVEEEEPNKIKRIPSQEFFETDVKISREQSVSNVEQKVKEDVF